MSVDIGIIGLPQSGRTTVFNALTRGHADTTSHHHDGMAPRAGVAKVPDPRLDTLAGMFKPKKLTHAEVKYLDIGTSVRDIVEEKCPGQFLNQLTGVDAFINVARAFRNESVPHPEGSVDATRDIAAMEMELAFSDLALIEGRLARIEDSLKSAKQAERAKLAQEQGLLTSLKNALEEETPLREMELEPQEARAIAGYRFLTAKPLLTILNIGEEQLGETAAIEESVRADCARPGRDVIALCGELEMEMAQLDPEAAAQFQEEFGIAQPGLDRAIQASYRLLGLISFLTTGADEVRAWPIQQGTSALKAAGKIHTDIEKGFIRAEVIGYEDFIRCGGIPEARKQGLLRLEGKDYTVRDGDIINFLFNV